MSVNEALTISPKQILEPYITRLRILLFMNKLYVRHKLYKIVYGNNYFSV